MAQRKKNTKKKAQVKEVQEENNAYNKQKRAQKKAHIKAVKKHR